jgi:hypothetical protein
MHRRRLRAPLSLQAVRSASASRHASWLASTAKAVRGMFSPPAFFLTQNFVPGLVKLWFLATTTCKERGVSARFMPE